MSLFAASLILFLITIWMVVLTFLLFHLRRQTSLQSHPSSSAGIKHWSLLRFNPFSDTGGSHSFVIALLDDLKNGIILTSLHGRGVTRFYAKQITAGKADQDLSDEEKKALNNALKR